MPAIAQSLKKHVEVFLMDGLLVFGSLLGIGSAFWRLLEPPPLSVDDITSFGQRSDDLLLVFVPVCLVMLVYVMARRSTPSHPVPYFFYGIGLLGMVWLGAGLTALLTGSVIMALPGLFIGYLVGMKHQAGDKGLMKIVNAAYDHGSRAVLLPAVVFLFITGSEYLLATRFAPGYAVLAMFLVYLPIRFMFAFKEPFRFFHFIVMAAAFFVYAQRMIGMLEDSPGSPVWRSFAGYLGDSVLVAREEGERAVLFVRNRDTGGRFVTVRRGADRKWEISRNN